MKSICFFTGSMSRGGGTEHMTQLVANALAENENYKVFVLSKSDLYKKPFYKLDSNVIYEILDNTAYKGIFSLTKDVLLLNRFVRNNNIEILINVDVGVSAFSLPLLLLCPQLKQVFWDHFSVHYSGGNKRMNFLRELALKFGNAYVTLTPEDAEEIKADHKKTSCIVTCIPNICPYEINLNRYDSESKMIISVGNTIPVKGFDMAIQVADRILKKYPDWKWIVYGDGSSLEELQENVNKLGLKEQIFFAGRVRDLAPEYRKASFFVLTSRSEGFGMVLTEAQAFHLPTIAFDVPYGPRNIIRNGINGYLIQPFDIDQMTSKVEALIQDKKLREAFSSKAAQGLAEYSAGNIINKWNDILENL